MDPTAWKDSLVSEAPRRSWGTYARWHALGRLLPASVRERVFEPAFADLLRDSLEHSAGARTAPFAVRALGTYLGCVPPSVVRLFVVSGKLTRLARVMGVAVVVSVAVGVVAKWVGYAYGYGP